jgi:hypothetical protein
VEELNNIENVEKELDQSLSSSLNAKDVKIYGINAQTAIGKSRLFIKYMKNSNLIVAAPTNGLKRELCERAYDEGIDNIAVSPSLHELELPDDLHRKINKIYNTGRHRQVVPYLKKEIEQNPEWECSDTIKEFLRERDSFNKSICSAITTHKNILLMDGKRMQTHDAAIIDEDIISKAIIPDQIVIPLPKLERVLNKDTPNAALTNKIKDALKRAKKETFFELDAVEFNEDELERMTTGIDILSFCKATRFMVRKASDEANLQEDDIPKDSLVFYRPVSFNPAINTVIVSATMDETICRYVFGDIVQDRT